MSNTGSDSAWGWSLLSVIFTRVPPTGVTEDRVQFDLAFVVNPTAGTVSFLDPPTHMSQVETDFDTLWTTLKARVHSDYTLVEYRWHSFSGVGTKPGPAVRVTSRSVAGTNVGTRLPDQDAATVSFKTASRKHWGRIYLPGLTNSSMATRGMLDGTVYVDAVAAAFHTFFASVVAHAWGQPVVASRVYNGLCEISELQMDDIPDIQRRRRANRAGYKKVYTS